MFRGAVLLIEYYIFIRSLVMSYQSARCTVRARPPARPPALCLPALCLPDCQDIVHSCPNCGVVVQRRDATPCN